MFGLKIGERMKSGGGGSDFEMKDASDDLE